MTRLRVGLLTNPTAASGAAARTGRQVTHLLRLAGLSVIDVSGPSARIARARALEVRDSLTALVVVGGDGTLSLGAEVVEGTPVRLGVVPAGSGNDFARALGLPVQAPEESVRSLLQALSRPVVAIDALEITSAAADAPPSRSIALGNVSLGFDALVNARANRARHPGSTRYAVSVLQELRRFTPIPYWIEMDGGPREELDASLLTVANTGVFGGGMRLVPDAAVDDGLLRLAAVSGLGRRGLLRLLPRVYRGSHTSLDVFAVREGHRVTVGVRDDRSLRSYADGDARALLPVTVRVLPGAVRVLADLRAPSPAAPVDPPAAPPVPTTPQEQP